MRVSSARGTGPLLGVTIAATGSTSSRSSATRRRTENGGGYDDFVDRMLRSSDNSSADVINGVALSGKTVPAGGELNGHVWYDFPTMGRLADRIAAALPRVEPADAGTFREHAKVPSSRPCCTTPAASPWWATPPGWSTAPRTCPGWVTTSCGGPRWRSVA
ncbi:metal ABC transporter solute-binding protein, Zn/Mn family [Streptomyces xanthophaeus]|uniref:metal ABC transporter solute-binding protein, Zn/Mn family n=1 Tax=Streptomyces xanthophaeus TaxID=67385 RepID=UPI003F4CE846